jgi:hypothetical protein
VGEDGGGEELRFFDVVKLEAEFEMGVGAVVEEVEQAVDGFDLGVDGGWLQGKSALGAMGGEVFLVGVQMLRPEQAGELDLVEGFEPVEKLGDAAAGAFDGVRTVMDGALVFEELVEDITEGQGGVICVRYSVFGAR